MFRLLQNSPSVKTGSFTVEKARLVVNLETQEDSMERSASFGQSQTPG